MPTIINVYLAEVCGNTGMTAEEKNATRTTLAEWFSQICSSTSYSSNVTWVNFAPAVSPTDLLCYFLPSELNSLLSLAGAPSNLRESHGKTWISPNGTLSEVYVARCRQGRYIHWIPQLAFHELMHNKLGLSDADLHSKDGLARIVVRRDGSVDTNLAPGRSPSSTNLSDMRRALGVARRQWTGGWAANCANFSDPLAGANLNLG